MPMEFVIPLVIPIVLVELGKTIEMGFGALKAIGVRNVAQEDGRMKIKVMDIIMALFYRRGYPTIKTTLPELRTGKMQQALFW